ncbi:MAG: sulfotransferase [Myxococcota bacterium]
MGTDLGAETRPIFITGRFRSGTTVLWHVLRQLESVRAYFEPLHDNLPDHVAAATPPDPTHVGVEDYFAEYAEARSALALHDPDFGVVRLCLAASESHPALEAYLQELARLASPRRPVFKLVRADLRLPWLRREFPSATIVSIRRDPRENWASILQHTEVERRLDPWLNTGYDLTIWAANLVAHLPELGARRFESSYETAYLLWRVSAAVADRYADRVIDLDRELRAEPRKTLGDLLETAGLDAGRSEDLAAAVVAAREPRWPELADRVPFADIEAHCDGVLEASSLLEAIAQGALEGPEWPASRTHAGFDALLGPLVREVSQQRRALLRDAAARRAAVEDLERELRALRSSAESGRSYTQALEREVQKLRADSEREIAARDLELVHRGEVAAGLEEEIRKLRSDAQRELGARDAELARRSEVAEGLGRELERRSEVARALEAENAKLQADAEREILARNAELERRSEVAEGLERELERRAEVARALEAENAKLQADALREVAARDAELARRAEVTEQLEHELERRAEVARALEAENAKLQADAEREIAARDAELVRRSEVAEQLEHELERRSEVARALEAENTKLRADAEREIAARDEDRARQEVYVKSLLDEIEKLRAAPPRPGDAGEGEDG